MRRFAVLAFLLFAAMPRGQAQTAIGSSVPLVQGNQLVLYGLTFTVGTCTLNGAACATGNDLQLANVPDGRGNIEYQVYDTQANTPVLSQALTTSGGSQSLVFSLTVAQTAGQPTTTITSAALTDTGIRSYTCGNGCSLSTSATGTAQVQFPTSKLTTNPLVQALTNNTSGVQSYSSSRDSASAANPFTYTETLSLNAAATNYPTGTLQLNSVAVAFRAAPEPASIASLLVGLGGLVAARRRRRAAAR